MKQYITPEQTAKLIELGFDTPRNFFESLAFADKSRCAYSIGELIEMLPMSITNVGFVNELHIYINQGDWLVEFSDFMGELYSTMRSELVDALYDMVIKLKDEGVI